MLRVLFYAIPIVAMIYAIVDCLQTPDSEIRGLPRFGWLLLILFFPILGSVVWLLAGRARGGAEGPRIAWPAGPVAGSPDLQRSPRRILAPDDDPDFLSQLGRTNRGRERSKHDALLEQWEEDLRRRTSDPRDDVEPAPGDGPGDEAGPPSETGGGKPPHA